MTDRQATSWSADVEAVYKDHGRELWAMFYSQCCDAESAHDALQEAFTRLHEQNGTPINDVRAWVLRVGSNWLRDVARRRKVAARSADHLDTLPGRQYDPATILEREETFSGVRRCLAQLRMDDREVLVLRYALGWSSNQMAVSLETTNSAIDMRLLRARRRLAELLESAGINNETI